MTRWRLIAALPSVVPDKIWESPVRRAREAARSTPLQPARPRTAQTAVFRRHRIFRPENHDGLAVHRGFEGLEEEDINVSGPEIWISNVTTTAGVELT